MGCGGANYDRPEIQALRILCAIEPSAHPFFNSLIVDVYSYSFTDLFCCCVVAVAVVLVIVVVVPLLLIYLCCVGQNPEDIH
jgi:hypothetical protein